MDTNQGRRRLIAVIFIIILLGISGVTFKFFALPEISKKLVKKTGSESQYKETVKIAADSFSGYAVLRSDALQKELKPDGIKLEIIDDKADYNARAKSLKNKEVQMAVYTIDSFISSCSGLKEFPGTIAMVIDESKGADGIVAYNTIKSFNDLNSPDAKFVLTPNSPSEFLARIVIANMSMPNLPEKWIKPADGAEDAYRQFRKADKNDNTVFVLWQPYISRALGENEAVKLMDSEQVSGYIIDVLVIERQFLLDRNDLVKKIITAYLRTLYTFQNADNGMVELVKSDAEKTGGSLSTSQSEDITKGIVWRNTLENYAYFGLAGKETELSCLEDIIGNIVKVLIKTNGINDEPVKGQYNQLFYTNIMADLQKSNFNPSKKLDIIKGIGQEKSADKIRSDKELAALSDEQWKKLKTVGTMRVNPINFGRGTTNATVDGQRELQELTKTLKSWPQYYLEVNGQTRSEGDADANALLAQQRAQYVVDFLVQAGVNPNRIKAKAEASKGEQIVSFVLKQMPY